MEVGVRIVSLARGSCRAISLPLNSSFMRGGTRDSASHPGRPKSHHTVRSRPTISALHWPMLSPSASRYYKAISRERYPTVRESISIHTALGSEALSSSGTNAAMTLMSSSGPAVLLIEHPKRVLIVRFTNHRHDPVAPRRNSAGLFKAK
jgi:hypothetical protein